MSRKTVSSSFEFPCKAMILSVRNNVGNNYLTDRKFTWHTDKFFIFTDYPPDMPVFNNFAFSGR